MSFSNFVKNLIEINIFYILLSIFKLHLVAQAPQVAWDLPIRMFMWYTACNTIVRTWSGTEDLGCSSVKEGALPHFWLKKCGREGEGLSRRWGRDVNNGGTGSFIPSTHAQSNADHSLSLFPSYFISSSLSPFSSLHQFQPEHLLLPPLPVLHTSPIYQYSKTSETKALVVLLSRFWGEYRFTHLPCYLLSLLIYMRISFILHMYDFFFCAFLSLFFSRSILGCIFMKCSVIN